jgi:4-amino-4-deoxy-L-arabinose transferase-like glycosyltransferase
MSITSAGPGVTTIEPEQTTSETRLRPRRTLNRLFLGIAGVAVAAVGQLFFAQESLWDGLLFYAIAILLFNAALTNRAFPNLQSQIPHPTSLHSGWRQQIGVWLILLAGAVSIFAYNLFGPGIIPQRQAWWAYIGGLILLVVGGLLLTQGDSWRGIGPYLAPQRTIVVELVVVIALALFMRLYSFGSIPFGVWYDEAEAGLQARRMLQEPAYRPVFFPSPINHPIYLPGAYALALAWFGDSVYSMRLVSVLFGLGGVAAAYLFGRELRGPRFGLALAFVMAVARWPVNFSRIAMTGIDTPFFEFLSLFFLVRLIKHGRLRDALWTGITLGVGLMVYTGLRLYVLALIIFAVVAALIWPRWLLANLSNGGWKPQLARLALVGLSIWLITFPVIRFALDSPQQFWYRTRQISIFAKRDQAELGTALLDSTSRHLLMFNFNGDRNGRHNLPGEPMLDPAMAVLAVLGLGLALAGWRRPINLFFLILFPVSLLGGILSVDFEAPQSLRSIAVMPAPVYCIGLALAALGREAKASLKPLSKVWVIAPAVVLAGFMLVYNASLYFGRQATDFASWNEFSTAESIMGRKMAELGPDHVYYLSPLLSGHPSTEFLAPGITDKHAFALPDALPIREAPEKPVVLFIHPDDVRIFDEAQRLYPQAEFETISSLPADASGEGRPVVHIATLQPTDVASLQGLDLRYTAKPPDSWPPEPGQTDQTPLQTLRAPTVETSWPADSPVDTNFLAEWTGILYAPDFGSYVLRVTAPGPARLELDGNLMLEGEAEQFIGLTLAQGNHLIRLQAQGAPGEVALYWQPPNQAEELIPQWALYAPPVTNHGLLGTFYPNDRWAGQPALQRIDPFLDTYFHLLPLRRPYTVEWTGALDVPQSGVYSLALRAVQQAELYLDGDLLVKTVVPDEFTSGSITLEAGRHDLLIRFEDTTDRSRIHLAWTTPSGQFEPIPSEYLWPPLGRYPERPPAPPEIEVVPLRLTWVRSLGGPGADPGRFLEPRDAAVLSNGNLVVADTGNRRVQILDPHGEPLSTLSGDEFPFEEPLAVGVNSRDEILILDSTLQWVYRYDAGSNFIDRFGGPAAQVFHPRGLTILENDTIVLADTGTSTLAFFGADGAPAGRIGSPGSGPGQFNEPTDVLRTGQNDYVVVEAMNNRIQLIDPAGNPQRQWTIPPGFAFNGPHLALGPDGSIFMTESQSHSLLRFAPNGDLLDQWQAIEPINLLTPVGIYFDAATSRLYITDVQSHQIHVFGVEAEGE